jgi:S1/P1 nuclease
MICFFTEVFMRFVVAFLLAILAAQPCRAWWESGHQIIALLAYDLLDRDEQLRLLDLLKHHPRLTEDFVLPSKLESLEQKERWLVGRAGYWPDAARSQLEYDRSNWHYQLGAAVTLGDVKVPKTPGPAPADATLETHKLHIAQAIEVCRRVLPDKSQPASDRALAICWLLHLVGDAHQPCHAGSLYVDKLFPEGDRGGNLIPTKQHKNLHSLWDSLLGDRYDARDVHRRCVMIRSDVTCWGDAETAARKQHGLDPLIWLAESVEFEKSHVYSPDVLDPIQAVSRGLTPQLEMIDLSDEYLKAAGELARIRAAFAAHRLARILSSDLQ